MWTIKFSEWLLWEFSHTSNRLRYFRLLFFCTYQPNFEQCWFLSAQELKVYPHKHALSRSLTRKGPMVTNGLISGYFSRNKAKYSSVVWHVTPTWGNHISSQSSSWIADQKKKSYEEWQRWDVAINKWRQ